MSDTKPKTPECGTCPHFHQFREEPRGDCYRFPPVNERGSKWRPMVSVTERCCGEHPDMAAALRRDDTAPMAERLGPTTAAKLQPDTPGAAAKAAREQRGRR